MPYLQDVQNGDTFTVTFRFRNAAGALVDPSTPTYALRDSANNAKSSGVLVQSSTGVYTCSIALSGYSTGTYYAIGCGTYQGSTLYAEGENHYKVIDYTPGAYMTTVEEMRAYLKGAMQAGDEWIIRDIIASATNWIEAYCARKFTRATVTNERHEVDRVRSIALNHFPALTISTILFEENYLGTAVGVTGVPSLTYATDLSNGYILFGERATGTAYVTYTYGGDDLPVNVRLACMKMVEYLYFKRGGEGVAYATAVGSNVSHHADPLMDIKQMLAPHKQLKILRSPLESTDY